jgi:hypothetical protein
VIEHRRRQRSFGDGLIAAEVADLGEAWMRYADRVLADDDLVATVYGALVRRHPKSATHGRPGAPAEMVLRLLVLKHVRNWSYQVLGTGGAGQSGVSRLHPRRRRQSARCQDDGPVGLGSRAGGDRADP